MSDEHDKLARIVEARMKLRARFQAESRATPSMSDPQPLGSGPPNRHGMPRLPVGQVATEKWPGSGKNAATRTPRIRGATIATHEPR